MSSLIPLPPSPSQTPSPSALLSPLLESAFASLTISDNTNPGLGTNTNTTSTPAALVTLHASTAFTPFTTSTPLPESQSAMTPPVTPPRATPFVSSTSQTVSQTEEGSETGELPAFFSAVLGTSSPFSTLMPRSPGLTAVSSFSDTGSNGSARSPSPASAPAVTPSRIDAQRSHVRAHTHTVSMVRGGDIDPDADSDDDPFGVLHSFNSSPRIRTARIARSLSSESTDPNANSRSVSRERQEFNFERSRSSQDERGQEAPGPAIFARAPSPSLLSPPFATPSDERPQSFSLADEPQGHQARGEGKGKGKERAQDVITIDAQSKQVHFLATDHAPGAGHRVKLNPTPPASSLPLRLPSTLGRLGDLSSNAHAAPLPPAPAPAIIQLPPTSNAPQNAGLEFDHRTPNVYINGLPPNYPESSLYTLTCAFGGVRSVRTFTRHVGGRASGYGFVLFESVDAAEQCIEGLRNHRNLHPSFSKMHKIPGTPYAPVVSSTGSCGDMYSEGDCDAEGRGAHMQEDDEEKSFRVRMEKLKDPNSSNLYFEGLPLSIDEPTMAALVAPHSIRSSRFFQTKLSDPPRIIAFVRLETPQAAGDIIERLHGRMVRGWNEPGCRISVRLADSAEQRELRRTERVKEGEPSPNRLTIAQAALLNLRGQDVYDQVPASTFQPRPNTANCNEFTVKPRPGNQYNSHHEAFASNAAHMDPRAGGHASHSPAYGQSPFMAHSPIPPGGYHPDMTAAWASMRAGQVLNGGYRNASEHLAQMKPRYNHHVTMGQARTASGFTAVEEQILRAHGDQRSPYQQYPPQPPRSMGMHGPQGASRSAGGVPRIQETLARLRHQEGHGSHTVAENPFHGQARGGSASRAASQQRLRHHNIDMPVDYQINPPNDLHTPPAPSDFPYSHEHVRSQQQHNDPTLSNHNYQPSQAHLRSTTLPPSHFSQRPIRSRQHNSSISAPANNTNIEHITLNTRSNHYINTGNHHDLEHEHGSIAANIQSPRHNDGRQFDRSKHLNVQLHNQRSHDPSETESPLVSPALTFGSARTPSTLSPSTPFFSSTFALPQENYKGHYQEQFAGLEMGGEKQQARH
ncbi:hypothetical protein FIBSPDRAFT_1042932 [Athelia psychrophila]|uniref:RRM domain-containing protein n=1 Tax=Athelia psychrophila TaxID=1759441 RepID=A0A166LZU3_9AGAM|nr:hypothetical protein FIBSPDRAFT_1042932 [Fibularhizoctonia sp. CBS 109695]